MAGDILTFSRRPSLKSCQANILSDIASSGYDGAESYSCFDLLIFSSGHLTELDGRINTYSRLSHNTVKAYLLLF